jgi:ADP-heptose:LPS heptosyltransferase/lauroyl/myristoyl acyltransferase
MCVICGNVAMIVLPARRRLVLSNLHHAFPNRERDWYKKICRENFYRLIELGLLNLAGGFFSDGKIRKDFSLNKPYRKVIDGVVDSEKGAIVLVPHFTSMEAMTFIANIVGDQDLPDIGVIYRPFASATLEKFIKKTRERFGMRLISRSGWFFETVKILRRGGIVALLFDQNARDSGHRMVFLGREISSTDLPVLLYEKFRLPVFFLYPRRIGFWKADIVIKRLNFDENNPKTILFAANKYLENILKRNDGECADWLWAHNRWKLDPGGIHPSRAKRSWAVESNKYLNIRDRAKNFRMLVRMPNWLGDVAMAIPVVRMLRASADDAELTLLCQEKFVDFLKALHVADVIIPLPEKGFSYFFDLSDIRYSYYDVYVSLVNSLRGDLEAFVINAPRRIGIDMKNMPLRKLFINNLYAEGNDITSTHQTTLWRKMLRKFGFCGEGNFEPFKLCCSVKNAPPHKISIGAVCGSANEPRKRWPVECWRILFELIFERYGDMHINLYGTKADLPLTSEIASSFFRESISNLAGQTTLLEMAERMQRDKLVIAVDTGGMHIANMFGCRLVCLYGPTNPISTGPIFNAKVTIIRPDGCPSKGGFPMENLKPESVFNVVQEMFE